MSSISTRPSQFQPVDSILTSDGTLTDHSTWSQECQWRESLKLLVLTTWSSRDSPRVEWHNNSSMMESQRQSDHNNGRTIALKSNQMEDPAMSEWLQLSTQDGGNYSEQRALSSSMTTARSLMSKEESMLRTEMSWSTRSTVRLTNNGISSTLMNGQKSLKRESWTKISDSMSWDHSILFQLCQHTSTSTWSTTEIW